MMLNRNILYTVTISFCHICRFSTNRYMGDRPKSMTHIKKKHQKELARKRGLNVELSKRHRRDDVMDPNLVEALLKLPKNMKNALGVNVVFPSSPKDQETIAHISVKRHHLRVSDILSIPAIIADPKSMTADKSFPKGVNYVGKRPGEIKEAEKYLKIVTRKYDQNTEIIKTIYPIKKSY